MEQVVEHVLSTMRQRLDEQLTLDDLAKTVNFSKYYFARMFRRVTGVPPRRYLYALRLQEAKRLLVGTSFNVAEISNRVGYHSVGTFTSRFTTSVGVPPAVYRRCGGDVSQFLRTGPLNPAEPYAITGRIEEPADGATGGPVLVGAFPDPIPEGRPVRCEAIGPPGDWALRHVPTGCWHVLAVAWWDPTLVSICGPVRVGPECPTPHLTVHLRPMRLVDPPLLAGLGPPSRL
jgi:AraC family transcriptional regulator